MARRRRYRIVMNKNGWFMVQRRFGLFWYGWIVQPNGINFWGEGSEGTRFETSEEACQILLKVQEQDDKVERSKQWTVVIKEER
jgi:hypothetical protein